MYKGNSFIEKRAYLRFPVRIPVNYFDPNLNRNVQAYTYDISFAGVCLVTESALTPGNYLDISLKILNGGRKIVHRAKVVWTSLLDDHIYKAGFKLEDEKLDPIPIALKYLMKNGD